MKQSHEITTLAKKTPGEKKAKIGKKPREVDFVTEKKKRAGRPRKYDTVEEAYAANKEKSRARAEKLSLESRDIAPLPMVENPERKAACKNDFMKFCTTYLPVTFELPWSKNHESMCGTMQEAAIKGGSFAWCDARGGGKTTICEAFSVWYLILFLKKISPAY